MTSQGIRCKLCGKIVTTGQMAQTPDGYVCRECVWIMAESPLVEVGGKGINFHLLRCHIS